MQNKKSYQKWLAKASDDLKWTEANLREKVYYGACFTAQQAAEKALKAYLLYKGKRLRKIHDLGALLEECRELDEDFDELREACTTLTDYYVAVRYPDISDFMGYTRERAGEALEYAKEIVEFIKRAVL